MYHDAWTEHHPTVAAGRKFHRGRWMALELLLGVVAGCSNQKVDQALTGGGTKQVTAMYPLDGFLPRPELLHAGGAGQPGLVYFAPETSISSYNSILLDPVTIVSGSSSTLASASEQQRV